MESKFSNDDYYAIYKEYKQKYVDLKNSVLEGGGGYPLKASIDKIKNDKFFEKNMNTYNKTVDNDTILNDDIKYKLKYKKNSFDSKELDTIKDNLLTFTKLRNDIIELCQQIQSKNNINLRDKQNNIIELKNNLIKLKTYVLENGNIFNIINNIERDSNNTYIDDNITSLQSMLSNENSQSAQGQTQSARPAQSAQSAQGQTQSAQSVQSAHIDGSKFRLTTSSTSLDARPRPPINSYPSVTNNSVHGSMHSMQSNRPTSSHFHTQNNTDYTIKKGDKFLIFDINKDIISKIKDLKDGTGTNTGNTIIDQFLGEFRTFHQSNFDPEKKEGIKIMSKDNFKEKLTKDQNTGNANIKDAYIITITQDNAMNGFFIRADNLNDTPEIKQLTKIIDELELSTENNKKRIMNDCYKLEEINFLPPDYVSNEEVSKHNEELQKLYKGYKLSIDNIKQTDIEEIDKANYSLKEELEKIRGNLQLDTYHIEVPLNTDMMDNTLGFVTVGNQSLLREIKKKMGKQMEDGSMIFKIKETNEDYFFAEFINKFRPYSSKNIAYLLLDFAISHKRYYTLPKY